MIIFLNVKCPQIGFWAKPRFRCMENRDDWRRSLTTTKRERPTIILTNSVDSLLYYESCHTLQATCKLSLPDLGLVTTVEDAVVWSAGLLLFDRRWVEVAVGPLPNILHSTAMVLGRWPSWWCRSSGVYSSLLDSSFRPHHSGYRGKHSRTESQWVCVRGSVKRSSHHNNKVNSVQCAM